MEFQYLYDMEREKVVGLLWANFTRRLMKWAGPEAECSLTPRGQDGYVFSVTKSAFACHGSITIVPGVISATLVMEDQDMNNLEPVIRSIVDQEVMEFELRPFIRSAA